MITLYLSLLSLFIYLNYENNLISISQAKKLLDTQEIDYLIDVRSIEEYLRGSHPKSINLPLDQINSSSLNDFDKDKTILIHCRTGKRAKEAVKKFKENGFKKIFYFNGNYQDIL